MTRYKKLEALAEAPEIESTVVISFRELYEDTFRKWIDSDVELIQISSPFRIKSVREAAQLFADYFTRQSELSKPFTVSGLVVALRLSSCSALDNYKSYHEDMESLIDYAKMLCELYAEEALYSKNSSGPKFILMNRNKWSNMEKQEITQTNVEVTVGKK